MANKYNLLVDEIVQQNVQYLSFMGNFRRYDFAIMSERDSKKKLLIDLRKNRFAVLDRHKLAKEGSIEHAFHVTEMEADELRVFLGEFL